MMIPGPGGEHAGVYVGDNRELVKQMPDGSVHCIVTSPPYWGLRSYLPDTVRLRDDAPDHIVEELRQRGIIPIDSTVV